MRRLLETDDSGIWTLQRIVLGILFFAHGSQLMLGWFGGHGYQASMRSFEGMGMPAPVAALVIFAQFFGAFGLLFGFFTRIAAAGISAVMLGAIALVHAKVGFFMNWLGQQHGEGFEFHLLVLALSVPLIVVGAGAWSIDGWLSRLRFHRRVFA